MNVTSKGRYALRVMLDLAQHPEEGFISLKTVADRQGFSMKYLEMIVGSLKKAGLVDSTRGKEGGYRLNRSPAEYSVGSSAAWRTIWPPSPASRPGAWTATMPPCA